MAGTPIKLTLPPAEASILREAYAAANVILEYGTGGSTLVAASKPGCVVQAVESDAGWLAKMQDWFESNPPAGDLRLHLGDIGPTKEWGFPAGTGSVRKWPNYPMSIWRRADFQHPDCVLIDGRFRLACFLTVLGNIRHPVKLLWDDYAGRPNYHAAEMLAKPVRMIGRMALFELTPTPVEALRQSWMIEAFVQPG